MLEAVVRIGLVDDRCCERTARRQHRHFFPVGPQCLARAGRQAIGKHDRIDRTGARSGDAFEFEPAFLEQPIDDAPSEGAVAAAALQRQIDDFSPGG